MESTLTIRIDVAHRNALRKRARAENKDESEVARELLTASLEQSAPWDDIDDLLGSVTLPKDSADPLRKKIREHNWRK